MSNRLVLGAVLILVAAVIGLRFYLDDNRSAEGSGAPLAQVNVPAFTGAAKEGEALFNANCASCHGTNAAGNDGAGPPLVHIIYEPSHHGDAAFLLAARNGVRAHHWKFGDMAPVDGVSDDDIGRIVAYVRALQRANGIN